MNILSKSDIEFMLEKLDIPIELRTRLNTLSLSLDDLIQLQDLCSDRLPVHGFNADYSVNEEGRRLEELIDKLFHLIEGDS